MTQFPAFTTDERFALDHRRDDVAALALRLSGRNEVNDAAFVVRQVDGWQRLARKAPSWAACDALHYPPRLSVEQASGEAAARYKARLAQRLAPDGGIFADLTGGMGIDFAFVSAHFGRAVYMERNAELCRLARHNFPLVGAARAEIKNVDSIAEIDSLGTFDLLLIDPARRDAAGRKTVRLADCEPDLALLAPRLLEHAPVVVAKLSPMLDHREAVRLLPCVSEIHLVSVGGECKELLVVMQRKSAVSSEEIADSSHENTDLSGNIADAPRRPVEKRSARNVKVVCVEMWEGEERTFCCEMSDETEKNCPVAQHLGPILADPGPALMKSGAFRAAGHRFGLALVEASTHLYTADAATEGFPGRQFAIEAVYGFDKRSLRELRARYPRANLAVRGIPVSADELRRRLKLSDGGDTYIFAAQTAARGRCLIVCRRQS